MRRSLHDRAKGRWGGILSALVVDRKALSGRHCPCPACGGRDRFRFDDKDGRGTWICSHCGAGNGVDLVMRLSGWSFREAAQWIEGQIGSAPQMESKAERSDAERLAEMRELWRLSSPIAPDDATSRYLARRIGPDAPIPEDIRHVPACPYGRSGRRYPAMLALYRDPEGKVTGLHRTYLGPDGSKAPVPEPKLSLGHLVAGGAVRLCPPAPIMGIAEGIETALSAMALFNVPTWAALNEGRLKVWQPPVGVREVVVFADNDENFVGQRAAHEFRERMGDRVRVRIEIPPAGDWNDVLQKCRRAEE